jgi:hypothetical protein
MSERMTGAIGLVVVGFVLGVVMGYIIWHHDCPKAEVRSVVDYQERVDTITRIIQRPTVYVHGPARLRIDTVSRPTEAVPCPDVRFVASLDTVVNRDTLTVAYEHPRAAFTVLLRTHPDSIAIQTKTITITTERSVGRAWWIDALTHVGAASLGYIVGGSR